MVFCIFISCGTGKKNETKEINIEKEIIIRHISLMDLTVELFKLDDITVKLSNRGSNNEPFIEVKSDGLNEGTRTIIDNNTFNKIFNNMKKINFDKLKSENHIGDDGFDLEIIINESNKPVKKVSLWSPTKYWKNPEINKFLNVYEKIKILSKYEDYYKLVQAEKNKIYDEMRVRQE
jgi:hypothetical protein